MARAIVSRAGRKSVFAGITQHFARSLRPGLVLTTTRAAGRPKEVFFHQGDLDGACGAYCVLMAMTILGATNPDELKTLPQRKSRRFAEMWRMIVERFFDGMRTADIIDCVEEAPAELYYREFSGRSANIPAFCVEEIRNGAVVIAGVEIDERDHGHWTLVVGWEAPWHSKPIRDTKSSAPTALLCLDPSHTSPMLTAYNMRAELHTRNARTAKVRLIGNDSSVMSGHLDSAIAIALNPHKSTKR